MIITYFELEIDDYFECEYFKTIISKASDCPWQG